MLTQGSPRSGQGFAKRRQVCQSGLLLPTNQPHFEIVGIEWKPLTKQISAATEVIRQTLEADEV
jgi:hypothetical protein